MHFKKKLKFLPRHWLWRFWKTDSFRRQIALSVLGRHLSHNSLRTPVFHHCPILGYLLRYIMLVPEMLNLLGCSKDNFVKLIKKMNYKSIEKENKIFFRYFPLKNKDYKNDSKKINKNSPFRILKELTIK